MSYKTSLVARLKDADEGWPHFETADFMDTLDAFAEETFTKKSVEGHLAAMLIWHQLCEEMAKLLLQDAQFFIQLSVYPSEIVFKENKKLMFGQVLEKLSETISFEHKEEFLIACQRLNSERIALVHRLTQHTSLADIMPRVVEVKKVFDHISRIFDAAHDFFRVNFHSFYKDSLEFMEEDMEEE